MALRSVDGKAITHVPHEREFLLWKARLSEPDYEAILSELENRTRGKRVEVSSWIPGDDWSGTPFQPIYDALRDYDQAARFFGLIVWVYFLSRDEEWIVYKPGDDSMIRGTVYFQPE